MCGQLEGNNWNKPCFYLIHFMELTTSVQPAVSVAEMDCLIYIYVYFI